MKVVFLDVDGVLNGDYMCYMKYAPDCDGYLGVASKHVRLLADLLERSKDENGERPAVVLTSSWKYDYDDYLANGYRNRVGKYLRERLRKRGVSIYETTTKYETEHFLRGAGIANYLIQHKEVAEYAILDDESFDFYRYNELISHFVHTDGKLGLTEADVEKAVAILNGGDVSRPKARKRVDGCAIIKPDGPNKGI